VHPFVIQERNPHRKSKSKRPHRLVWALVLLALSATPATSQTAADTVLRISLSVGRAFPVTFATPVTRVAVANPDVADAVAVSDRDVVINAKANGETDVLIWAGDAARRHYRVMVRPAPDRQMILLSVRMAEVRRDLISELGLSALYRDKANNTRAGTGLFRSDNAFSADKKTINLPIDTKFLTVLSDFGTEEFLAFLDLESRRGRAKLLAEPNLMTANRDSATFLAGGELPIPIVQPSGTGQFFVTIQYREFGVRLKFVPEIVSDSIISLWVRPEVSSLDYGNAINISGFRIPALRTRRVESSVDVRRNQSVVISGLFNDEQEKVRTGIPLLMDIPILGALFGSTRWQRSESELLVVVTPTIIDPANMNNSLLLPLRADTTLPAREAIEKRLPPPRKP
jgi:pilus assembly protein CpaC